MMLRLSYRFYLWAAAFNYHLPRRLTKGGLLVGAGMLLAGAIGSDIDQSMASQAFALLFCLFWVGFVWVPFFRGRFHVERNLPRLASVDEPFRYDVRVRNESKRAYRHLELLEDLADPRPTFEEFTRLLRPPRSLRSFRFTQPRPRVEHRPALVHPARLAPLNPGEVARSQIEVVPLRRGPLRFAGMTVARPDPFGLVRSFVRVVLPQTVLVLPKRHRVPNLGFSGRRNYQPGGVSLASNIGESEEFIALREYRPGDPFRRIHWRSWARVGRPIVKEHQEEDFVRHALILDTFTGQAEPDAFEEAISVAASFACTLDDQESLLDLLFVGCQAFCCTSGRALGQAQQLLEVLASVRPAAGDDFTPLRNLVLRHAGLISGCICVFVHWDEARKELVRQLRARGLAVLTLIISKEPAKTSLSQPADEKTGQLHFLAPGTVAEGLMALRPAQV